jgi:hypothetical protein
LRKPDKVDQWAAAANDPKRTLTCCFWIAPTGQKCGNFHPLRPDDDSLFVFCHALPNPSAPFSEMISNSTSVDVSNGTDFKGCLETVPPSESTELQRKRRFRERI